MRIWKEEKKVPKNLKMKYRVMQETDKPVKIYVYDEITATGDFNWETWQYDESDTSANHFAKMLADIPDGTQIELHVNSYGGEVKEGVAIYNLLKQKNCQKTCYIDCFAYSVAYVIAMACDKIIMGLGSSIMIHEMWTVACGNADELRKQADDLDVLMQSNRQIFLARCNLDENTLIDMMKAETILTPEKCLEYGFCDEISEQAAVEQSNINQCNQMMIMQMRHQMNSQMSLKESMKEFCMQACKNNEMSDQTHGKPEEHTENKALNMLGAFFDAFASVNLKNNK